MRIGSLFSGIGGLELGLEWAGVGHTVWQVEYNAFCRQVLAKHWPDAQRFNDVREVGAHNLEAVDVICGGYPCQPFSTSGEREGASDQRHLWPEFARILGELRPRYAVLENVAGHLSLGFGAVLGDLSDLGYNAEWSVVSACAVGAPHSRERVFVIAYAERGDGEKLELRSSALHCASGEASSGLVHGSDYGMAWPVESRVLRDGNGVSAGSHRYRLRALGNAVVPQVAQVVGQRLLAIHRTLPLDTLPSPI